MTSRHRDLCVKLYLDTGCGSQLDRRRVQRHWILWSRAGRSHLAHRDQLTAGFLNICSIANSLTLYSTSDAIDRSTYYVSLRGGTTSAALRSTDYKPPTTKSSIVRDRALLSRPNYRRTMAASLLLLHLGSTWHRSTSLWMIRRRLSTFALASLQASTLLSFLTLSDL